jgi:phosphatidylserine decarboxylase
MKQYDTDSTNALSHLELTSMLDSLGSTLSSSTLSSFFARYGKKDNEEELTFDEIILCLEEELNRPEHQKKRLEDTDFESVSATPVLQVSDAKGKVLELDQLDFSGPAPSHGGLDTDSAGTKVPAPSGTKTEPMQIPSHQIAASPTHASPPDFSSSGDDEREDDFSSSSASASPSPYLGGESSTTLIPPTKKMGRFRRKGKAVKAKVVKRATMLSDRSSSSASNPPSATTTSASEPPSTPSTPANSGSEDSGGSLDSVERVINIKTCPLCHRPRMNSKAEMDIMTHIAVCASQDWNRIDRIVVGNFVTASQAQRKWYTKVIGKLSSGNYKLGAVSSSIPSHNSKLMSLGSSRTRRILLYKIG